MSSTKTSNRGLGRGLSALIPDADMELLRQVARGEQDFLRAPIGKVKGSGRKRTPGADPDVNGSASAVDTEKTVNNPQPSGQGGTDSLEELIPSQSVVVTIPLDAIEPNPYQPRRFFNQDELSDLANSIRNHGVLQPIVVRPLMGVEGKQYQLVAGERRWRASQLADIQNVPAIVREINDQQALELALIENVQRHDISAIDAALAYKRLASEFRLSQEEISQRVGKSRSAVANTLRLLDLQEEIRKAIEEGELSEGHGRAILLANGDGARRALFRRIMRDKFSVRETERLAREIPDVDADVDGTMQAREEVSGKDAAAMQSIESALQKKLGAKVKVRRVGRGGRIHISFASAEDLQRLLQLFGAA